MKTLKFRQNLVDLVENGSKNSTWRLFDDKDLRVGDDIELLVWETKRPFAKAVITKVMDRQVDKILFLC